MTGFEIMKSISFNLLLSFNARVTENNILFHTNITILLR